MIMTRKKQFLLYLCAFFIPVIFFILKMYAQNIHPFGDETFIVGDLRYQLILFFNEFSRKISNTSSLFYSWNRGMGTDFYSEITYYLSSPINILSIFFNRNNMYDYISLIFILKNGLCGLTFFIYIKKHFETQESTIFDYSIMLLFSYAYSTSAYFMCYSVLIMWIDGMIMLPVLLLSLEYMLKGNKTYLYPIFLSLTIFSNYYIAFMICIFLFFYFFYFTLVELHIKDKKFMLKSFIRFMKYSLLAALSTCVLLVPNIIALSSTAKPAGITSLKALLGSNYNFFTNIYALTFFSSSDIQAMPKLYCGVLVVLLLIMFLINRHISISKKIGKISLLLLVLLSMQFKLIEFVVNGFHAPNGFVGRNSFIAIFLLLVISCEAFQHSMILTRKRFLSGVVLSIFLTMSSIYLYSTAEFDKYGFINLCIILLYATLLYISVFMKKKFTLVFIVFIMCLELFSSMPLLGIKTSEYDTYTDYNDFTQANDTFYRTLNLINHDKNLGSISNYNSLSTVSSVANDETISFLSRIGAFSSLNASNMLSFEPVFSSILGVKYVYSNIQTNHKLLTSTTQSNLYQNNNALSIAFEAPKAITDITFSDKNAFENINEFSNAIINQKVYEPIVLKITDNKIIIPQNTTVYLYSKKLLEDSLYHYDDNLYGIYSSIDIDPYLYEDMYNSNYIVMLPENKQNGYIELSKATKETEIIAYKLNMDNFHSLINVLSANQMTISKFTDNYVYGILNAVSNDYVVTSIPYSRGWRVKVDNKKVNTFKSVGNLLTFDISTGEHTIELYYVSPYFYVGLIMSVLSIIVLIITLIKEKGVSYEVLKD